MHDRMILKQFLMPVSIHDHHKHGDMSPELQLICRMSRPSARKTRHEAKWQRNRYTKYLPPGNEVCEGCLSQVSGEGGFLPLVPGGATPRADTPPPARHPPGRHPPIPVQYMLGYTPPVHARIHPPPQCMLGYGQQAGGTHPTGMHSCDIKFQTNS